jgi:hypothetical protein
MISRCVYCPRPHLLGLKAPWFDFRVTDGMCRAAADEQNAKFDAQAANAYRVHDTLLVALRPIMSTPKEGYLAAPELLEADLEQLVAVVKAAFEQRVSGKGTQYALAEAVDKLRGRAPSGAVVKS